MNFIGVDLHKKSITVCVMDEKRKVLGRKTLACTQTNEIVEFFRQFRPFKVVVEATASYVWFVELVEPLAEKVVLANPKKLRVIAESTKKTDRLDAQVLTEFLVLDMIPESYQPTPRQRQHRALVRHRQYLQGRITSVRSKIRHILSNYNADRKDLFSANCGAAYLKEVRLSDVDRFVIQQLWAEWQDHLAQRLAVSKKLKAFVAKAPQREAEAREILKTAPGVGPVTAEVVLSELGDISRFRNAKTVCAYAGLVPVVRQSGERKSKNLKITKEGSGLLRWALVEAAWRLVGNSPKWAALFARLMHRSGKKRAIVAVARKLLCVLYAMLRTSTPYQIVTTPTTAPPTTGKESVRTSTPDQTTTTGTTAPRTIATGWPSAAMPVLSLLSLISRNSPKRLNMVSPELLRNSWRSAGADLPGAKARPLTVRSDCIDPDEVVRRLTQVEQGPVPPELSMVSPELRHRGSVAGRALATRRPSPWSES